MSRIWLNRGLLLAALGTLGMFAVTFGCKHSTGLQSGAPAEPMSLELSQKADVQIAVGRTLEARGQTREAVAMFAEAVKNDPRRADAWVRLAVNCDKEGMFVESADYYQKALDLDPNNADTYCNLGYSLYLQERMGDAESATRRALELKPDHARAQNNLGLVLARSGREDESLRAFQLAGCSEADAHSNVAYGLTLRGAMKEAGAHYEQAVALDPKGEAAKKGQSELAVVASKQRPPAAEPSPVVQTGGSAPAAKIVPLIAPLK
jgi:Flp pilus assembly protein TadD